MDNICGNKPVTGDNFYGRQKFVKLLVGMLISKNSFLLLGLRRIGKSSTIAEALRIVEATNNDIVIIKLNCQTYRNLHDFYKELHLALPSTWQKKLRDLLKESKRIPMKIIDFVTDHVEEVDLPYVGSVKLRNDVLTYANPLKEEITKFFEKQQNHIVLFIDELPFLFENINKSDSGAKILEIESVLTTLRDWRNIGISQAICGSLNLHVQLTQMGISKKLLAGLNTQQLPLFSNEEAYGLIDTLARSSNIDLSKEQIQEMVDTIPDNIPQFLQYYFFVVKTYFSESDNDLKKIYESYVYPMIVTDFEYQFEERLSFFNIEERAIVQDIFNILSREESLSQATILKSITDDRAYGTLLRLMEFEFISMDKHQHCQFALKWVANWWTKKSL